MEESGQCHTQLLYPEVRDLVPIENEAGWAPGLVWTGAEYLDPLRFDPQTIWPILNCYTDYAIVVHKITTQLLRCLYLGFCVMEITNEKLEQGRCMKWSLKIDHK
jgi:hypothetical protein